MTVVYQAGALFRQPHVLLQPEQLGTGPVVHQQSLTAATSQLASLPKTGSYSRSLAATNAQASLYARSVSYLRSFTASDAESANLAAFGLHPRLLATSDAAVSALQRLISIIRPASAAQALSFTRLVSNFRSLAAADGQATAILRPASFPRAFAAASAQVGHLARVTSYFRSLATTDAQASARVLAASVIRGTVDVQAAARALLVSINRGALDAQHTVLAAVGLHPRVLAATGTQTSSVQRLTTIIRASVDAQVVLLTRAMAGIRATTSPQNAARTLSVSAIRRLAATQTAAMAPVTARFRSFVVGQAEAVSSLIGAVRPRLLSLAQAQVAFAVETYNHAGINTGKVLSAASADLASLLRATTKLLAVASSEVGTATKALALHSAAASPEAFASQRQTAKILAFARQSTATYFDITGTLQTAAANVPRIGFDPITHAPLGLIVEAAATNLAWPSGSLAAPWNAVSVTVTANNTTAPDGTLTAARLAYSAIGAGNFAVVYNNFLLAAAQYTMSVWLRGSVGGEVVYLIFNGNSFHSGSATLTTSWQRFTYTSPSLAGINTYFELGTDTRDVSEPSSAPAMTVYAWGWQVEAGTSATSYIPTTTAPASRAADTNFGAADPEVASVGRMLSAFRLLAVLQGQVTVALAPRAMGIIRLATQAQVVSRNLAVSIIRASFQAEVALVAAGAAHIRSLAAAQAEVVSRLSAIVRVRLLSAIQAQIAAAAGTYNHAGVNTGLALAAVSAEASALLRSAARMLSAAAASPDVAAIARLVSRIRALVAVSPEVSAAQRQTGKILAAADPAASALRRMVSVLRSAFDASAAASIARKAQLAALSAVQAEAITLSRGIGRFVSATEAQASALVKAIGAVRQAASGEIASRGLSIGRRLAAVQASAPASSATRLRALALALLDGQALSLLAARSTMHVTAMVLGATSTSASAIAKAFMRIYRTTSPSAATETTWYHRFLPLALRRRVVRLPPARDISTLPRSIRRIVLPPPRQAVMLPGAIRRVVLPREEDELSDYEIHRPEPAFFSPFDPTDEETFTFDWTRRGYPNDAIIFASVVSVPAGVNFLGPAFIDGQLVEVTVGPFLSAPAASVQPVTYSLRCMAVFASGRISNYSVPFQVQTL
jgi:hypothetical protein